MTLLTTRPRPTAPPAAAPPQRHRSLPWLLVLGWLGQVCVRLWFSRARTGPVADPDETGYLAAARWLSGGPGADLSGNTFYQGGYPLLFTPVHWATSDPAAVYLAVMVVNALVGAAAFPLGYLLARRLGLSVQAALPLAWAAALLPAVTFFGAFALADAVLPVVFLGWLLALDRFVRGGEISWAVVASLAAVYATSVHSRGSILLAVHGAALFLTAVRRLWPKPGSSSEARSALCGIAATMAGYAAASVMNGALKAELYPGGVRDLGGILEARLTTLDGQAWALSGAAGQLWYLAVSTWGLGAVGLVGVAVTALRPRTPGSTRFMAAVLLTLTFGIAYASSAALPDEHRVGNFAYGRYLSCLALVYALAGLAVLARVGGRVAVRFVLGAAAVIAVTGLCVTVYAGERLRTHTYIAFDFPETAFLTGTPTALHLTEASLAGLGLLGLSLLLRRFGWPALMVAPAAVSLAAMTVTMGPAPQRTRPVSPLPGPAAGGVAADVGLPWPLHVKLVAPVWWTRVDRIDLRRDRPAAGVRTVVAAQPAGAAPEASWPAHPAGWRAHPRESYGLRWVVWQAPAR